MKGPTDPQPGPFPPSLGFFTPVAGPFTMFCPFHMFCSVVLGTPMVVEWQGLVTSATFVTLVVPQKVIFVFC